MTHYAYLDLCFFERCNLTCTYCRTTNEGMLGDVPLEVFQSTVRSFLRHSMAAVFKVSGYGEISLWPHLVDGMKEFASCFPTVQIITNGTMPLSKLGMLLPIENLVFCVTIDGHGLEANSHRTGGNLKLHEKMLAFIRRVLSAGRGIELNCVLTAANLDGFADYLAHVRDNLRGAMVMPFPVRPFVGLSRSSPPASADQVTRAADRVLLRYEDYATVLPGRAYLERLFDFMGRTVRGWPCYVPAFNYGVGPRLSPLSCACLGHTKPSDDLLNLVVPDGQRSPTDRLVDVSGLREERVAKGFVDERCGTCFTHYEVLNLWLEGAICTEEICTIPSFRRPQAQAVLEKVRAEIDLPRRAAGPVPLWQPRSYEVRL